MHLAHGVQVRQALQRLSAHERDLPLRQRTRDWKRAFLLFKNCFIINFTPILTIIIYVSWVMW
jgi:hypothetical protein